MYGCLHSCAYSLNGALRVFVAVAPRLVAMVLTPEECPNGTRLLLVPLLELLVPHRACCRTGLHRAAAAARWACSLRLLCMLCSRDTSRRCGCRMLVRLCQASRLRVQAPSPLAVADRSSAGGHCVVGPSSGQEKPRRCCDRQLRQSKSPRFQINAIW